MFELASVESILCSLATLAINKEKKEISIKGGKQDHLTLPDHLLRFGIFFFPLLLGFLFNLFLLFDPPSHPYANCIITLQLNQTYFKFWISLPLPLLSQASLS